MNILRLTPYPLIALILFGCATVQKNDTETERLGLRVTELKRSLDETNTRLEDLNNKFVLLLEKVDSTSERVKSIEGVPASPPEGLSVVSLEGAKVGPAEAPAPAGASTMDAKVIKSPGVKKAEGRKSVAMAPKAPEKAAGGQEAQALYNKGQDLFMAGDFAGSRAAFKGFVDRFPGNTLADNALYWLGESYYSEQDYYSAVLAFKVVVEKYPEENKAPDALLKLGYSYIELDELSRARQALDELFSRYPKSDAARKGKKKYQELFG